MQVIRLGLAGGVLGTEVWKGGCLSPPLVRPRVVLPLPPRTPPILRWRPGSWEVGGDSEGRGGELVCLRVCWLFEGGLGTTVGGIPTEYRGGQARALPRWARELGAARDTRRQPGR